MKAKYIPNILSAFRIFLVFVFVIFFFLDYPKHLIGALCVFLCAGLTDVVDGYLARRNNWITDLGKLLDPFADKLMQCTVLVCLATRQLIPVWLLVCYMVKELAMVFGSFFLLRRHDVVTSSGWCGKIAVCVFYAGIFSLIVMRNYLEIHPLAMRIVCLTMLLAALVAIVVYFIQYFVTRRKMAECKRKESASAER